MYRQLFLLRIKGINVLILVWSFSKCKINLIFHPPTFSGAFTRDILASSVDLWRQILLKLQDLCFVERSNSAFKHWIVVYVQQFEFLHSCSVRMDISSYLFSFSLKTNTRPESWQCRLLSAAPEGHDGCFFEGSLLSSRRPIRVGTVTADHSGPKGRRAASVTQWTTLTLSASSVHWAPWEKQLRKVSWWCSTC